MLSSWDKNCLLLKPRLFSTRPIAEEFWDSNPSLSSESPSFLEGCFLTLWGMIIIFITYVMHKVQTLLPWVPSYHFWFFTFLFNFFFFGFGCRSSLLPGSSNRSLNSLLLEEGIVISELMRSKLPRLVPPSPSLVSLRELLVSSQVW